MKLIKEEKMIQDIEIKEERVSLGNHAEIKKEWCSDENHLGIAHDVVNRIKDRTIQGNCVDIPIQVCPEGAEDESCSERIERRNTVGCQEIKERKVSIIFDLINVEDNKAEFSKENKNDEEKETVITPENICEDPLLLAPLDKKSPREDTQESVQVNVKDITVIQAKQISQKNVVCEVCYKSFSWKSCLMEHMRVHTKEKPFTCHTCNRGFACKGNLVKHSRIHTKERPFICKVCRKAFTRNSHLEEHTRVHTKEKPFICDICNKAFNSKGHLVKHIRMHTKERPYVCQVCYKDFAQRSHLVEHTRVHTKEKPYICELCSKVFSYSCSLKKHLRKHQALESVNVKG